MHRLLVPMALALAAGCGGGGAAYPDAGPHVDAGPEPTSLGEVLLVEGVDRSWTPGTPFRAYGSVLGRIRTAAYPVWHQEVANDGTCRLLKFMPAQCDEYCEGVCVERNVCQPYPREISVGTLTLTGLIGGTMSLQPADGANWYYPRNQPPAELFADDAVIGLSASGSDDMPAFHAEVRAVPRLEAEIDNFQITLHDGEDYVVRWTPAGDRYARVRLTLNSNNSGHAFPYDGIIECEAYDDDQEIRVPAAMIDAFPETDNWEACAGGDCPRSWLRRYSRGYAPVPGGGVRFDVGSEIDFGVVHHR